MRLKLAVVTGRRIHYVHSLHERFGPVVRISPYEVAVADPDLVQQVHKQGSAFKKSDWYLKFTSNSRESLFTLSDHKLYAARRKMISRGFSKTELQANWEAVVKDRVQVAVNIMIDEGTNGPVDVLKWLILMSMDISTRVVFGGEYAILEARQVSSSLYGESKPLTIN
jgi:cytochrome P450